MSHLLSLTEAVDILWQKDDLPEPFYIDAPEPIRLDMVLNFPALKVVRRDNKADPNKRNWIIAQSLEGYKYLREFILYPRPEYAEIFYKSPRRDKGPGDWFPGAGIAMKIEVIREYSEINYVQYLFKFEEGDFKIPRRIQNVFRGFRYKLVETAFQELVKEGVKRVVFEYRHDCAKDNGKLHDVTEALKNTHFSWDDPTIINESYASIDARLSV
ncbi:MAG: hypothetical protein ABIJ34_09315 [archaeon]